MLNKITDPHLVDLDAVAIKTTAKKGNEEERLDQTVPKFLLCNPIVTM